MPTLDPYSSSYNVNVRRVAAVSCGLDYSINRGIARGPAFDTNQINSMQIIDGSKSRIENITNEQFLVAVYNSFKGPQIITSIGVSLISGDTNLLGLIADSKSITNRTFDALFDASLLQSRVEKHIAGVSHQITRRLFLTPDDTASSGSIHYTVQKLYIRAASLWTMVGLLATVSCLVVIIIAYNKPSTAPQCPATIAATAYTLSRSHDLNKLLGGLSAMRLSEIRKALTNYDFITVRDRAGVTRIEAVVVTGQKTSNPTSWLQRKWNPKRRKQPADLKPKRKGDWMPFSARGYAISLTILLPTVAIVVLEILWYLSENNERFVIVSSDSSIDAYIIRFGSTATVLAISTLFNALDFAIATMSSFSVLAAGNANPERTIFFTIIGDLPPVALYKEIRHRHLGAALSLIASTIGKILTVVVSGLWFDAAIGIPQEIAAEVRSGWNIESAHTIPNSNTIAYFDELQHGRPDESTLIWDNIVLPEIGNPQPSITSDLRNGVKNRTLQYSITLSAIRPYLKCTILPQSAIEVHDAENTRPTEFRVTALLPAGCGSPSDTISFSAALPTLPSGGWETWVSRLSDLDVRSSSNNSPSEGCPSIGAIFGTYEHHNPLLQPQRNITAVLCTQYLQSVEVNTSYSGNLSTLFAPNITSDVHLNSPPLDIIDARSNSSSISVPIADSFLSFDAPMKMDRFFYTLTNGPGGTNRENLLGSENTDTLISAMNNLYQKFMVHVIDREYRSTTGSGNGTIPIPNGGVAKGTVTIPISRLKINGTSKIILQAFLSTMVVFGGLAWWCVDLRVLPRNPYPIASSMAFLAGSRLVEGSSQTESQEQPRTIRRKPLVVMKGKRFRLGWWEDPNAEAGSESDSNSQLGPSLSGKRFGIDFDDTDRAASITASKTSAVYRRKWFRLH
ncbi:hypothetical protein F4680DRAFT_416646 [Xylaria scruposa]|nr:hypothetical protein F4680DRAFT_416646 [Xylaria scruposa]